MSSSLRIFDIGANLTDEMFKGTYHGKTLHAPDLISVLERAQSFGVEKIMVTAGSLYEFQETKALLSEYGPKFPGMLSTTIGVHPTRSNEFENFKAGPDAYLEELLKLVRCYKDLNIKAIGEFGLDYDRIQFSAPDLQRRYFEAQFALSDAVNGDLPLFLHMREAAVDFTQIVQRNRHRFRHGVVHSFTGTLDEARQFLALGLNIGVNGCSFKTPENLKVIKELPLDCLMVESDAPWCEIRPSNSGSTHILTRPKVSSKEKHQPEFCVKSRNEPFAARQVLEILAALHQVPIEPLSEAIYQNTLKVFGQ